MGFWILGGIVLALAAILSLSVAADVRYAEELSLSVGICGFRCRLLPAPEKPAPPPRRKKSAASGKKRKKKPAPPEKPPEKGDLKGTFQIIWDLLKAALPPVGELLGKVRLVRLRVLVTVGGSDAAETALEYGRLCALVYGGYAALQSLIRVKAERVELNCDFLAPETVQEISFRLKLRVGSILWAALRIAFRFLTHTSRKERQRNAA